MRRSLRNALARVHGDAGMTIIELSIVVALLGVVIAAVLSVMYNSQTDLERQISRVASNDQVRLAMQSLDREVRSGDVLYDPASESYDAGQIAPGMSMRIYTESNFESRGNVKVCDQWRITTAGELQERRWDPLSPPSQLAFRTVATGITNRTDNVAAFARPNPGAVNIINVVLRANNSSTKGATVEIDASLTGRNTSFFSNNQSCGPASAAPVPGQNGIPQYL